MTVQATETKKKGLVSGLLSGGKGIWAVALILALIVMFGALSILGSAAATQTYYVLNQSIPARTQITSAMLVPLQAKVNSAPPNALDPAAVANGQMFAQVALKAGDVVSSSVAGPLDRITADVPNNFVAASFEADPQLAVAGKVRKGDFIDIIATDTSNNNGTMTKVVLAHVLVLDVTVSPASIAQSATDGQAGGDVTAPGPESQAVRGGIPSVYTVAVDPTDAAKLALARTYNLYVVLSANVPDENLQAEATQASLFNGTPGDSSQGTYNSVYIIRYDHAFDAGNTFVDNNGTVWKVNPKKQWVSEGGTTLNPGDVPPGYLQVPAGSTFTDAKGAIWVAQAATGKNAVGTVWTSGGKTLTAGTFPQGYDPHQGFPTSPAASNGDATSSNTNGAAAAASGATGQ